MRSPASRARGSLSRNLADVTCDAATPPYRGSIPKKPRPVELTSLAEHHFLIVQSRSCFHLHAVPTSCAPGTWRPCRQPTSFMGRFEGRLYNQTRIPITNVFRTFPLTYSPSCLNLFYLRS